MFTNAHIILGWTIGVAAPRNDRLLRNCCLLASIAPDVDAIAWLAGTDAFLRWHRTIGHNVFMGLAICALTVWLHRKRPGRRMALAGSLAALCFGLHLLTDAYFTRYDVYLWWPVSDEGYIIPGGYWLGAPINMVFFYASFALVVPLAIWRKMTPIDAISPRLDRLIVNMFRRRPLECAVCHGSCNNKCEVCGAAVCGRHTRIGWGFRVRCGECAKKSGGG
jgi:hypothetical protein